MRTRIFLFYLYYASMLPRTCESPRLGRIERDDVGAARRLRLGAEGRPVVHEPATLLEQVAAAIGGLDLVANRVAERHLDDLARVGGALRSPVLEGRPEPMGHDVGADAAQHFQHAHVAERAT